MLVTVMVRLVNSWLASDFNRSLYSRYRIEKFDIATSPVRLVGFNAVALGFWVFW